MKKIYINVKLLVIEGFELFIVLMTNSLFLCLLCMAYSILCSNVYLCDGGDFSPNGWGGELEGSPVDDSFRPNGWGGELDGNPVDDNHLHKGHHHHHHHHGHHHHRHKGHDDSSRVLAGELDGRGVKPKSNYTYKPYRPYKPHHKVDYSNHGDKVYQPYRPGLQSTSEGYRYELKDTSNVRYNPVNSTDLGSDTSSTQLGVIEPDRNEVTGDGFYQGANWASKIPPTTRYNSTGKWLWSFIKNDLKRSKHKTAKAKAADAKAWESRYSSAQMRADRDIAKMEARNAMARDYNLNKKVRRFD
jgi:hypothetical protein